MEINLIPKEEKFFDLFEAQAERICAVAKEFKDLLADWRLDSDKIEKISDMEHEADITTHEIMDKLNRTFITPFDREDIHELASKMDDVIDLTQGCASRMHRYRIASTPEDLRQMSDVLLRSTETVRKAVMGLRDLKKTRRILDYCIEINSLENVGDQMQEAAMGRLFAGERDPIEVIKWKEIYELVETAIDKCEDVANTIESIVVKHG